MSKFTSLSVKSKSLPPIFKSTELAFGNSTSLASKTLDPLTGAASLAELVGTDAAGARVWELGAPRRIGEAAAQMMTMVPTIRRVEERRCRDLRIRRRLPSEMREL
ncbi:hypothetical protein C1H46_021116 [Malus baccata]|uniref:Uncharacterized protein n=1 Tax=Malus baccata TaxID=106549 RepID=A0A540M394_MALBA|nr:hypothetical protein C1H46_021116 [Malus baccata]